MLIWRKDNDYTDHPEPQLLRIMTTNNFLDQGDLLPDGNLPASVADYLAEVPGTADHLAASLTAMARIAVQGFFKSRADDAEDLVQESVVAVMTYLQRRGSFSGDLVKFTTTVARNRCRNQVIWRKRHHKLPLDPFEPFLTHPKQSPLDELLGDEVLELIQLALDQLDERCRNLLYSLYLDGMTVDEVRRSEGLKSVQSIYYRRTQCLGKAGKFLKMRLSDCSANGSSAE